MSLAFQDTPLTKDDLAQSNWQDAIAESNERGCEYYSHRFSTAAREANEAGETKRAQVLDLLGAVSSPYLKLDTPQEPFGPMAEFGDRRSPIPDDFSEMNLATFKEWAPNITDADLRARLGDVIWIRTHDYRMAELAIDAYLESATLLEDAEHWSHGEIRIERAVQIAAQLGKNTESFKKVVHYIEALLGKYNGEYPLFFSARLMELLLKYREGDPSRYAGIAEIAARQGEASGEWHKARTCWEIRAAWLARLNDAGAERDARLNAAESYVREAEAATQRTQPSYIAASHILQQGIEAFRRVGGTRERVQELHQLLLDYEARALSEMQSFSHEIDITKEVEKALAQVAGKSFQEALANLALIVSSPSAEDIRAHVEKTSKEHVYSLLATGSKVDDRGRVIARVPSMISDDPDEVESAIRAEMFDQARNYQGIHAQAIINPARMQITQEHTIRVRDLLPAVMNNPFVPPKREELFARGLFAGLTGDLLIAAHLLIPQIENSLRYLLNTHGIVTSKLDKDGIQEERSLGDLLAMPELKTLLGEDIVFDLQGILQERHGSNLRNLVSHGLMDQETFMSLTVLYVWWLVLHLCFVIKVGYALGERQSEFAQADVPTQQPKPVDDLDS